VIASTTMPSVLVVDDESGILDSLNILLRNEGFAPHLAHGGKAGLERIAEMSPDIVLTDIRMPNVSGVEILAAARQSDPDVPVILMTAQATLQSAMQAVNEGAFYYIQKPFRNDELIAILRRAAEHRNLRAENKSLKQAIQRHERTGVAAATARRRERRLSAAERADRPDRRRLVTGHTRPQKPRDRNRRDDADDGHHNQKLDKGEPLVLSQSLHRHLLESARVAARAMSTSPLNHGAS